MQGLLLPRRVQVAGQRLGTILGSGAVCVRRTRDHVAFALVIGLLGVMGLIGCWIALLLTVMLPRNCHGAIGRMLLRLGARAALRIATGCGLLECNFDALRSLSDQRGLVLVANHPSRLDAVLLAACLPDLICITKPSIRNRRLFGAALRLADYPAGDASELIPYAVRQLQAGRQLLVFPEGRRSPAGGVGTFRPGFAGLALRAGAPVQTLAIKVGSDYLGRDWPLLRRPIFPVRCHIETARRFAPPSAGQARELVQEAERAIVWALPARPDGPAP